MNKKPSTINDIAKLAGVSKTTVSFALNNPGRVGAETLANIRKICKELNYSPDPIARTLTTKKTGNIGFLLPGITPEGFKNPHLFQILQGMRIACLSDDYSLTVISPSRGNLLKTMQKLAVDGFVIHGMIHQMEIFDYLRTRNIPVVSLDGGVLEPIPRVTTDDEVGAYNVMQLVLSYGHKNIVILGFKDADDHKEEFASSAGYRRLQGYKRALSEKNIGSHSPGISVFISEECSLDGGYTAMEQIWKSSKRPTAIVAMSDILAMGVYSFCQDHSLSIPENLSVVGFDDIMEVSLIRPPLTTISQPAVKKGEKAVELLIEIIKGSKNPASVELKTELIKRQSVAIPSVG
ncbi:MAG: LacI family DNA-binding transcriptional regulator [Spirochaetaceae bacterium]|jgi:DNA-binding LacI/PurR family transcriptional regulator|nr:LacI family DNA-binding transcriptional regulator [Spirochaetaceae bacterium]